MTTKELGKIKSIHFGYGGYQDAQYGVSFVLGGSGWGVSDFWGHWGTKRIGSEKWSEESRITSLGEVAMRLKALLDDAKVQHLDELKGVAVEVIFTDMKLTSWRILKEVL